MSIETILITGANIGLGKESARQLGGRADVKKIYLAARNPKKAASAKLDLEVQTGRSIFEVVIIDTTDLASVQAAVDSLPPIDALVMNAGGIGGTTPLEKTADGVTHVFGANVLGHAQLLEGLLAADKLKSAAIYVGSEAARGIPKMRMKRPALENHTVQEFSAIADGSYFAKSDPMESYGHVKYMATLWMSSLAREYPGLRFVTVSPGGTTGTAATDNVPFPMNVIFKFAMPVMAWFGMAHGLKVGAKRYVDVLVDDHFKTGHFYASPAGESAGPMVDQAGQFEDLEDHGIQDRAAAAIRAFLPKLRPALA
jgi:NAD(P)-dependent dehydrogenase (short-subunit alcohol dehydrogenase family)